MEGRCTTETDGLAGDRGFGTAEATATGTPDSKAERLSIMTAEAVSKGYWSLALSCPYQNPEAF